MGGSVHCITTIYCYSVLNDDMITLVLDSNSHYGTIILFPLMMMMMGANHLHLSIGKQANYQQPPTPEAKQKLVRDRYSLFMNLGSVVV